MKKAAFFDVDHTIIDGNTTLIFTKHLFKKKILKLNLLLFLYHWHLLRTNLRDTASFTHKLGLYFKEHPDFLKRTMAEANICFKEDIRPLIYKELTKEITWHKKKGHVVMLISASLDFVIRPLAAYLGAEHMGSSIGEHHFLLCYGEVKRKMVAKYVEKHKIDLATSYAYSDHQSDLPLLQMVGHPVVVNPQKRLRTHAREEAWKIMDVKRGNL